MTQPSPNPMTFPPSTPRRAFPDFAADQLKSIVQRIENLEESKAEIVSDVRDIYAEARGNGLCPKTLRKIIALRKQDVAEREEADALLNTYLHAMGMQSSFNFGGDGE